MRDVYKRQAEQTGRTGKLATVHRCRAKEAERSNAAVDRERMNPKPEPLIPPPVKVSPFTHQVRGYNMALMTFGLVDPPKPKEAEK